MSRLVLLCFLLIAGAGAPLAAAAKPADAKLVAGTAWKVTLSGGAAGAQRIPDTISFTETELKSGSFGSAAFTLTGNVKRLTVTANLATPAGDRVTFRLVIENGKTMTGYVEHTPQDTSKIKQRIEVEGTKKG